MKKIFTLLCAAVIAVSTMNAEVLLQESFGQTTETLSTSDNAFANEIAATGWTNINGSGQIYMSSTDLTYAGYKSNSDATGSAEYKATFGKKAASPFSKVVNSGSVYMAGIVKIKEVGGSGKDYLWALGTATSSMSSGANQYARPFIQSSGSGFKFGITKLDEVGSSVDYTETEYTFGTYLVVVEYTFAEGDKNDVIKLYVNPTKGEKPTETLVPRATIASSKNDAAAFASALLYSSNSSKAACLIDELKVVTDWSDLWEAGEAPKTPTIIADQSFSFGNVNVNEAANQNLTIKGSNLKGAISIASDNAQLVVSAASVTKDAAESAEGASVSLTLTATAAGEGSAKITLSSEDATNKVINVTWNAVAPVSKISIAEAKKLAPDTEVNLNDVVITRIFQDGLAFTVQDATGALNLADYFGACTSWTVGDKISGLQGAVLASEDYMEGFFTVFPMAGNVAASGVAIEPLAVTLADFTKYGPAYIKVEGVSFPADKDKFAAGGITISQDAASANMQIPAGCDIIGEDVPSKADVKGLVCHPYLTDNILIKKSADVYNRVAKEPTGFENIQSGNKAVKVVRDGQLIILRDGKEYNVLGAEK